MNPPAKIAAFLTAVIVVTAMLLAASAQASKPAPEFTVAYVSHPYDVAPTTTSTTDPYTGKVTTTTHPGYHDENKTIEATITNPAGATYYNFRYKGHYTDNWNYYPHSPGMNYFLGDWFSVPYQTSNSTYTIAILYFLTWESIPEGEIDIQVQALFGNYRAVPYGHAIDVGGPTYDFYFEGEAGEWSNTQTITISSSPTATIVPQPTQPPNPTANPTQTPNTTATATPTNPTGNKETIPLATFEAIIIVLIAVIVALILWIALKLPRGGSKHA